MQIYCLFCETVKCDSIAKIAELKYGCRAISPKQVQHTRSDGKMADIEHDLLPGYVFLYIKKGTLDISSMRRLRGVIRCLCSPDKQYELSGKDEQFALMLLQHQGRIGKTQVYEEGQRIRIREGVYEGLETKILKVNRQKQRMQIEIPFAQMYIRTWVEFEIVEKPNQ